MFWGSFAGDEKGPAFFWEKNLGSIDSAKYYEYIIPLITDCLKAYPSYIFMYDNAPSYCAKNTT